MVEIPCCKLRCTKMCMWKKKSNGWLGENDVWSKADRKLHGGVGGERLEARG